MTNRVTDQTTQNGLIGKFRLKGLMPEMTVASTIIPVVQVATLDDAQNVSQFEKWRSILGSPRPLIDPSDISLVTTFWTSPNTKVVATNAVVMPVGSSSAVGGNGGCALPGGAVGVPATDGIYRVTFKFAPGGGAIFRGNVILTDQAAFGDPVALGTTRATLCGFTTNGQPQGTVNVLDFFVIIRETLNANAIVLTTVSGVNGTHSAGLYVQKLTNEIPPNVIFP